MPVHTVSSDQVVFVNGRPQLATPARTTNKTHRTTRNKPFECRAEQLVPLLDLVTPGSPVAVDCEGVILPNETSWRKHGVGRLSITNLQGAVVYDTFVHYPDDVEHRPSPQYLHLGVEWNDIKPKYGAQPHAKILAAAKAIFDKSGIVIAHAAQNDERMLLGIDFKKYLVRDTQRMYGRRALSALAQQYLQTSIQVQEHSSAEDARATMELFLMYHANHEAGCDYTGKPVNPNVPASFTTSSAHTTSCDPAPRRKHLAPGKLVALPDIPSLAPKGRTFDRKTSTYN